MLTSQNLGEFRRIRIIDVANGKKCDRISSEIEQMGVLCSTFCGVVVLILQRKAMENERQRGLLEERKRTEKALAEITGENFDICFSA